MNACMSGERVVVFAHSHDIVFEHEYFSFIMKNQIKSIYEIWGVGVFLLEYFQKWHFAPPKLDKYNRLFGIPTYGGEKNKKLIYYWAGFILSLTEKFRFCAFDFRSVCLPYFDSNVCS